MGQERRKQRATFWGSGGEEIGSKPTTLRPDHRSGPSRLPKIALFSTEGNPNNRSTQEMKTLTTEKPGLRTTSFTQKGLPKGWHLIALQQGRRERVNYHSTSQPLATLLYNQELYNLCFSSLSERGIKTLRWNSPQKEGPNTKNLRKTWPPLDWTTVQQRSNERADHVSLPALLLTKKLAVSMLHLSPTATNHQANPAFIPRQFRVNTILAPTSFQRNPVVVGPWPGRTVTAVEVRHLRCLDILLLRCLRPLTLSARTCRCGRPLDVLGHYRAA